MIRESSVRQWRWLRSADFAMPTLIIIGFESFKLGFGAIMAGSLLSTVPIVIVFLSMQSQIIAGLTAGAVRE